MKASSFDYVVAKTVADASAALASDGATTAAIAAGQSLLPILNLRVAPPDLVVDLGRLDELKEVSVSSDRVRIGALTIHATIEDGYGDPHARAEWHQANPASRPPDRPAPRCHRGFHGGGPHDGRLSRRLFASARRMPRPKGARSEAVLYSGPPLRHRSRLVKSSSASTYRDQPLRSAGAFSRWAKSSAFAKSIAFAVSRDQSISVVLVRRRHNHMFCRGG
jgi:FAD binding domain in molybdopterin dehydrogenase